MQPDDDDAAEEDDDDAPPPDVELELVPEADADELLEVGPPP